MSDTPRTDEAVKQLLQTSQHERVSAEFARKLEREVTRLFARKLEREVARLHQEIRDLQELKRDALKDINRITQLEVKLETEQQNVRTLQKLSESMWLMLNRTLPADSKEREELKAACLESSNSQWDSAIWKAKLLTLLRPSS